MGVQDVASSSLDADKVSLRRQFLGVKRQGQSKIDVQKALGIFVIPLSPYPAIERKEEPLT